MSAAISTFPGAPAHLTLDVRPTTETVRIAERFTKSAETTTTGRLSAGADPRGAPRSAHPTTPRAASFHRLRKVLVGFLLSHETRQSLCVNLAAWNPAAAGVPLSRVEDPVGDRHGGLHNSPEYNSSYPFSR